MGEFVDSLTRIRIRVTTDLQRDAGRAEMLAAYVLAGIAKALGGTKEDPAALGAVNEDKAYTPNTAALKAEARRGESSAERIMEAVESLG